jgi:uncharacterized protein (UPF0332 family)
MPPLTDSELLLVSKSNQDTLKNFADGVVLVRRAKVSIQKLQARVARDRLRLAKMQLRDAIVASKATPTLYRTTVSRAYYAMYHAARAATYLSVGGDDHEKHSILPTKFPADFPNAEVWKNRLKNARLERNRADYDPYPLNDSTFSASAAQLILEAKALIASTQQYIRLKT